MIEKSEIHDHFARLQTPPDGRFAQLVERFDESELCDRRNFVGHLTASGVVVLLPSREVLLLHHRSLGKMLAPGGHIEAGDCSLAEAALREIEEETGISSEQLIPANVSDGVQYCAEVASHAIPVNEKKGEDGHFHHDFRFLFAYVGSRRISIDSGESLDYEWVPLDDPYIREEILCRTDADALLLSALEEYERQVHAERGNDYLATPLASYLFRLGAVCCEAGDNTGAERFFERAVVAFRDTYDDEYETPPSILNALWNLAVVRRAGGRLKEACDALSEGLRASREFASMSDGFDGRVEEFGTAEAECRRMLVEGR